MDGKQLRGFGSDRWFYDSHSLPGFVEHEAEPTGLMTMRLGWGAGACWSCEVTAEGGRHRDRAALSLQ